MKEHLLEKMKFGFSHRVPLHDIEINIERVLDYMEISVRGYLYGRQLDVIKYPLNWKESFKERWFPKFLLEKYPVKYHIIDVRDVYPEIQGLNRRLIVEEKQWNI